MKTRTRIVTKMKRPDILGDNPQKILEGGSRVVTLPSKRRVFMVRKVFYDDTMMPMYANPLTPAEKEYTSLREILDEGKHSHLMLLPILDLDHSLKIWTDEQFPVTR